MKPPVVSEVLCDVLREVCRHLAIEESAQGLLDALAAHLPVDLLLLRRWDAPRGELVTVGAARRGLGLTGLATRTGVPTPHRVDLLRWADGGAVAQWLSRGETSLGRLLVPEGVSGPLVAGPLTDGDGLVGVFILGGNLRGTPGIAQALVEPFTLGLANDARLHELARLREAADADKASLLRRLGRQDVTDAIVGAQGGLRGVLGRVAQVAPTDAPVLVLGETGAGKEVVARAVHDQSHRARGPFLRLNCGAIPPELVDSELFGHERGSFTGAVATRKGWFERADGGTLFLDEIAELPAAAQVRLLRVLQDGTFQRVGGSDVHTVDVRIVAATHRDLADMVRAGGFRQDLWYRVSVFPLALPALRERPEDIPLLAAHFAERTGLRLFGRPLTVDPADVDRLRAYPWPGNVRELAAVIDRAAILGDGRRLDVLHALGGQGSVSPVSTGTEARQLVETLRDCHGRIEGPFGAAARMGVNPHTLRSRMRKMGVDWSQFRPSARAPFPTSQR